MKLLLSVTESEQFILKKEAKESSVKFALFHGKKGNFTVQIFGTHTQHSHHVALALEADTSLVLIGAGFIRKHKPEWGSSSCREDYGYDRPGSEAEARKLLGELAAKVLKI